MALKEIKRVFKGIHENLNKSVARDQSSMKHAHNIRINKDIVAKNMTIGINAAAKQQGFSGQIARESEVRRATNNVIRRWENKIYGKEFGGKYNISGIRIYSVGNDYIIQRVSINQKSDSTYARKVNQAFRAQITDDWNKIIKARFMSEGMTPKDAADQTLKVDSTAIGTIGEAADFSHSKDTSVANAGLVDWIETYEGVDIEVQSTYTRSDIAEKLLDKLHIDWKRTLNPKTKKMEWVVEGELAGPNPKPGDPDYIKDEALTQEWEEKIYKQFDSLIAESKLTDPAFAASEPFTHKIATAEMRRIADEYLKAGGFTKGGKKIKVKNIPKKPKASKRTGKIPPKKRSKKHPVKRITTGTSTISKAREKGQGNQASTSQSAELVKLKKYIQGRLPAEVRRNMGRPALQNRTGRFSNSVQLLSLRHAQNTVMAKYTYLLNPYQTFENKGKKRWPMAYNPKPVIAKSIRNLAQGRIEQKITVRRV